VPKSPTNPQTNPQTNPMVTNAALIKHYTREMLAALKPDELYRIGQRLSIIPVNISLCFNLYDHFYLLISDDTLQKERIQARGLYV